MYVINKSIGQSNIPNGDDDTTEGDIDETDNTVSTRQDEV